MVTVRKERTGNNRKNSKLKYQEPLFAKRFTDGLIVERVKSIGGLSGKGLCPQPERKQKCLVQTQQKKRNAVSEGTMPHEKTDPHGCKVGEDERGFSEAQKVLRPAKGNKEKDATTEERS